ncbi:helix-turn-helix transcriptional regulator [Nocardioides ultimimeridianus]
MTVADLATARDRLLAAADADLDRVLNASLAALHDVCRFRWAALMAVDPNTILPVSGIVEGFEPQACGPFWDLELVSPGYNKFADLARRTDPVATLWDATDGDLQRSPAYVELYQLIGAGDELRAVFVLGASCWGIVSLLREADDGPFTEAEMCQVRQLCRFIARGLRHAVTRTDSCIAAGSAMVIVDRDNLIVHATVSARSLLEDLRGVQHVRTLDSGTFAGVGTSSEVPGTLLGLVTRARSNPSGTHLSTRMRALSGSWMRITAARTDSGDGHVALVVEPARVTDLVPMVLEGYALTEREADIVGHLARGLSSRDIAAELCLSAHTVRDHVKSILHKCGASSRGELVAQLFAEHIRPSFEGAVRRV